jgi:hypothetical protein
VDSLLAYQAFYELKAVFQIRLFRVLWNASADTWEEIRNIGVQEGRGGPVWLAQDCIRVADLDRAEGLLRAYLKEDPKDYKGYCPLCLY